MDDLAALADDDEHLHVVLIGPSPGESVLVGTPDGAWLVVDSMLGPTHPSQQDRHPVAEALRRLGAYPSLLALTHPHHDHASGLTDLINTYDDAPVGCVPVWIAPAGGMSSTAMLLKGDAEDARAAIERAWKDPVREWRLLADPSADRSLGTHGRVEVLSPSQQEADAAHAYPTPSFNAISAAMRVTWHDVELILGADLTTPGWQAVQGRRAPTTGDAAHMHKASHHGSDTGHHAWALGVAPPTHRPVGLTPYNVRVPNFAPGRDIDKLHDTIDELAMTAVPGYAGNPGPVQVASIRAARTATVGGVPAVGGRHLAFDAWWAWSLRPDGTVGTARHGSAANVVIR
ncbi:MAG: MBL fold metallo-hydrolase [Solirubrobacteraceae bacterium MAG38_C4-C5]|nr:MBL fold metallo-hydrolase [Candidatus Siliceabacter maunaloa]